MSRKYKIHNQSGIYFVTFTVINWIDVFIRDEYRSVVVNSIRYCQQNKGLEVYAYCFMTSHIHLIIGANGLDNSQVNESREWMLKRMYYAGKYNSNNRDFQFWQQHSHPIELTTDVVIEQKLDYIHLNPVAAGFVDVPEAWTYSSARAYAGGAQGPIELIYL